MRRFPSGLAENFPRTGWSPPRATRQRWFAWSEPLSTTSTYERSRRLNCLKAAPRIRKAPSTAPEKMDLRSCSGFASLSIDRIHSDLTDSVRRSLQIVGGAGVERIGRSGRQRTDVGQSVDARARGRGGRITRSASQGRGAFRVPARRVAIPGLPGQSLDGGIGAVREFTAQLKAVELAGNIAGGVPDRTASQGQQGQQDGGPVGQPAMWQHVESFPNTETQEGHRRQSRHLISRNTRVPPIHAVFPV